MRRPLAAALILAGSVAAAIWLLDADSSPPGQMESTARASLPPPHAARGNIGKATGPVPRPAGRAENPAPGLLSDTAAASWESLARSTPASLGLALAPLGRGPVRTFGPLQTGHAWSTIKVPILVTLMGEQRDRALSGAEEDWAREALTASNNEAAAALYGQVERTHGGPAGAGSAVEETLRRAGDTATAVATAPPPSGAVSTYGQTDWPLRSSVEFFRALARECLLNRVGTTYVLDLMEEVVPEQRWGLGEAVFPPSWQVAIKGGWGPEGAATGPYLVRQSGILTDGRAGVVVAMMAQADSGSFDAGVADIGRVAGWLAENLRGLGGRARRC